MSAIGGCPQNSAPPRTVAGTRRRGSFLLRTPRNRRRVPGGARTFPVEITIIKPHPAKLPKSLKEAPQLAELVKAGKLPPVAERVGQDPVVIKPLREVGKYGGTWRGGFTGPADFWNGFRCCSGPDHLMFWDYTGDKVVPNLAKSLEMQDGGRAWLVHLRRGMKWSDGKPFTADDFVFMPRRRCTSQAPRHEVERRQALHRRRLRVLVR